MPSKIKSFYLSGATTVDPLGDTAMHTSFLGNLHVCLYLNNFCRIHLGSIRARNNIQDHSEISFCVSCWPTSVFLYSQTSEIGPINSGMCHVRLYGRPCVCPGFFLRKWQSWISWEKFIELYVFISKFVQQNIWHLLARIACLWKIWFSN